MIVQFFTLAKITLSENVFIIELLLRAAYLLNIAVVYPLSKEKSYRIFCSLHRTTRRESFRLRIEPYIKMLNHYSYSARPSRDSAKGISECFGVRILCLRLPTEQRKGVLHIKFSETFVLLRDGMDVPALLENYILVFEPSWSGYCDPDFLYYTQFDEPIFVLAAETGDFTFLQRLSSNLVPVPLGPCDWVNPDIAEKFLDNEKKYDIVMNSNWGPAKRHYLLFKALKKLPNLKVALIGGSWEGRTKNDILKLASYYGVQNQLTIFESLSFDQVMDVVCSAKISILLSRKEGSNRALAESIFCNVPVILISEHVGGIRKNVNKYTGWFVPERELAEQLSFRLTKLGDMQPRRWAEQNISYVVSNRVLEQIVNQFFGWDKEPLELVEHSNSPEMTYECSSKLREQLEHENKRLINYIKNF